MSILYCVIEYDGAIVISKYNNKTEEEIRNIEKNYSILYVTDIPIVENIMYTTLHKDEYISSGKHTKRNFDCEIIDCVKI